MEIAFRKPYPVAMTSKHDFDTFNQFWPYYLSEHADPVTRLLHIIGTAMSLAFIALMAWSGDLRLLAGAVVAGYGLAWYSHLFIERNRPATFRYPVWSLMGDLRMFSLACVGRLEAELKHQAGKDPLGP